MSGVTEAPEPAWREDRALYLRLLADRLVDLLDGPDADTWMDELAWEAEAKGWVTSAHHLRRTDHRVFAADLFTDNATAFERMSPAIGWSSDPSEFEELSSFQDVIV